MAPLLQELSTLEVEPLEIGVDMPESEQDRGLDTLSATSGEVEVAALLTGQAPFTNNNCDAACCCCIACFPCCC